MSARIFAVADALDAMTDVRPYRRPVSFDDALAELGEERGRQFDPDVVDAVDACTPDLRAIYRERAAGRGLKRGRRSTPPSASRNATVKLGSDAPPHGSACGSAWATSRVHQPGPCG